MSLDLAFGIARSGLAATQRALAQVSQNIANAETAGYTRKEVPNIAVGGGDQPLGVRAGPAARAVSESLLAERNQRAADAAAARVRETLLGKVEAAHGRPEAGESLGDAVAKLRMGFLSLRDSAGDGERQRQVLNDARLVATRFNEVSQAVMRAREEAHVGIVEEVRQLNTSLREVADISLRIQKDMASGQSVVGLEDSRDALLLRVSEILPMRALKHADGGITLIARNGLALPLDIRHDAFATSGSSIGPTDFHGSGGTLPGVFLAGVDVTRQLSGGRLAELVNLRDGTLPRYQAELDLAAGTLAARLDAQGLRLFTDIANGVPDTALPYSDPAAGLVGFAAGMRLNPAVEAAPLLLRDGTHAVADTPGGPTAFTPNPAGGPAGFATMVDRVTEHALGRTARPGTDWPGFPNTGLGPDGRLFSPVNAARTVEEFAAGITGSQTTDRAAATQSLRHTEMLLRGLDARFQADSGVDTDKEMALLVQLQNAYAANARVMNTAQQMWDQLLALGR